MSIEVSRRSILQLAMAPAFLPRTQVDDLAPTVSRVYPGGDGKLVYAPDEDGNTIAGFDPMREQDGSKGTGACTQLRQADDSGSFQNSGPGTILVGGVPEDIGQIGVIIRHGK